MKQIDLHADDYALSPNTSEDILKCLRKGVLDSISVMTNMTCFPIYVLEYQKQIESLNKVPLLSIHLNFIEGHCVADARLLPHLVDEKGYFTITWGKLLTYSYSVKDYFQIKAELKLEIAAQTLRFREAFGMHFGTQIPLRFDGHQHTQMIPIVYTALLEYISESKLNVNYIRITREPILPFVRKITLWKTYRPINWIKNILLNYLSFGMKRKIGKYIPNWKTKDSQMFLWGVIMSGKMDIKRAEVLLPEMMKTAQNRGWKLEIFFHPGKVLLSEIGEEFNNASSNSFYLSKNRKIELETLLAFHTLPMEQQ